MGRDADKSLQQSKRTTSVEIEQRKLARGFWIMLTVTGVALIASHIPVWRYQIQNNLTAEFPSDNISLAFERASGSVGIQLPVFVLGNLFFLSILVTSRFTLKRLFAFTIWNAIGIALLSQSLPIIAQSLGRL